MAQVGAVNIRLGATTDDFERAMQSAARALGRLSTASQGVQTTNRTTENSFSSLTGSLFKAGAGFLSIEAALGSVKKALQVSSDFQRINTALRAVSTSSADYARSQELLQSASNNLGLSYQALAESYKGIKAASNGTALEGRGIERVFMSVVKAGAALQISSDDTKGALLALQQMLSKGTVSAEELRGQLGERIPGAFGLMAKALNVTEPQLGKMMEQGQVLAVDVLPKFAAELEKTFGAQAQANVTTMAGGFQRLTDQASLFVAEFTDKTGIQGFFGEITNGVADTLSAMRKAMQSKDWVAFFGAFDPNDSMRVRAKSKLADQNTATVSEYKRASPAERQARMQVVADEYSRISKQLGASSSVVLESKQRTWLIERKQQLEQLFQSLIKVNFELAKEPKTGLLSTKTKNSFDQSEKRLKDLETQIKDYKVQGLAVPVNVQKEYDALKTKIDAVNDSFKKATVSKAQLLDISNVAIFKRELDKTLKTDPGNASKIFNLQNLIRQANGQSQLGVGVGLNLKSVGGKTTDDFKNAYVQSISSMAIPELPYLDSLKNIANVANEASEKALKPFKDLQEGIASTLENASESAMIGLGEVVGAMISGTSGVEAIPQMILSVLGDAAMQLGKLAIGIGISVESVKAAFQSLEGIGAIAAGVALIAIGSAAKSGAANIGKSIQPKAFADGGIVYGPTMGLVGEYPGARSNPEVIAPLSKLKDIVGTSGMAGGKLQIEVQGRIRGNDLDIIGARTKRANADKRGNR